MDIKAKNARIFSALLLIIVVVIFTIGRLTGSGGLTVTIGVDDEKVGIVVQDQDSIFIQLPDLTGAQLLSAEDAGIDEETENGATVDCSWDGCKRILLGNADAKEFLTLDSADAKYIIGATSKSVVEQAYQQLPARIK